ncbi:NAD(P)-binding protein [Mycena rosella]|uniref:NAD(P)-binding protein n=1 Tax=Mycena rosella TaxID=1033263 RepID=A0AAD7G5W7_MYCRO|nr:NAD(P)-binding protein [Mycena rosella]
MPISSSPAAPLVVVVGSTGNQGGSVIQALVESDLPYRIRGLTRDVTKPAAQKLAGQGVEMVNVSLTVDNVDAVQKVFAGANIAFIVTSFWEHLDKKREVAEGKMMVDAAIAAGVTLLVWSGLDSVSEISKGRYIHVDHFDGKAEITAYARASGVPLVIAQIGWYGTNHILFDGYIPTKEADGSYALALPVSEDTILPFIDATHDYGLFVREAIESPTFGAGTEILASGEDISVRDMLAQLSQITGKNVAYKRISDEEFMAATKCPHHVALELLESTKFYEEFGFFGGKDTKQSRQHLNRSPRTWADFVRATDWSSTLV